jgi:hypothetical protein
VALVKLTVAPGHAVSVPEMAATVEGVDTDIDAVRVAVPQALVKV